MANLRVEQKEQTRQRLLDTALDLFETKGYAATTIDDIAAAAGTTRVTFYAHFPSRRAIMAALIDRLNVILERQESSAHGSTASALVEVVRAGTPEAIGGWLRALAQEILAETRSSKEKIIPSPALRHDHPAAADLENIHLVNAFGKGDRLGKAHRLAAIADEDGRAGHDPLPLCDIQPGYT